MIKQCLFSYAWVFFQAWTMAFLLRMDFFQAWTMANDTQYAVRKFSIHFPFPSLHLLHHQPTTLFKVPLLTIPFISPNITTISLSSTELHASTMLIQMHFFSPFPSICWYKHLHQPNPLCSYLLSFIYNILQQINPFSSATCFPFSITHTDTSYFGLIISPLIFP